MSYISVQSNECHCVHTHIALWSSEPCFPLSVFLRLPLFHPALFHMRLSLIFRMSFLSVFTCEGKHGTSIFVNIFSQHKKLKSCRFFLQTASYNLCSPPAGCLALIITIPPRMKCLVSSSAKCSIPGEAQGNDETICSLALIRSKAYRITLGPHHRV